MTDFKRKIRKKEAAKNLHLLFRRSLCTTNKIFACYYFMQRTEKLKDVRPSIPTIAIENATTTREQFQNQVLRPVLKFQNDLLVALFKQYIIKRKGVFNGLSPEKKLAYIQQTIQRDQNFRNLLIGSIVGQFTLEEYQIFSTDENKLTKRMMEMCVQRLQDQLVCS